MSSNRSAGIWSSMSSSKGTSKIGISNGLIQQSPSMSSAKCKVTRRLTTSQAWTPSPGRTIWPKIYSKCSQPSPNTISTSPERSFSPLISRSSGPTALRIGGEGGRRRTSSSLRPVARAGVSSCRSPRDVLKEIYREIESSGQCVVQNYIDNPLLYKGLKFDLRIYALVAGCDPLRLYIYN